VKIKYEFLAVVAISILTGSPTVENARL